LAQAVILKQKNIDLLEAKNFEAITERVIGTVKGKK
jgi:hypothetical protein